MAQSIGVALIGVGNCAKSLVEALAHPEAFVGNRGRLGRARLGGLLASDIRIVAAFDIDARKVGIDLASAIRAAPNSTFSLGRVRETGVIVCRAPTLDGLPKHLRASVIESQEPALPRNEVARVLKNADAQVCVLLIPTGSDRAVEWWAETCIKAQISIVNAVPTFLAKRLDILERFKYAKCCYIGDDLKSQLGATTLHRALLQLCLDQGLTLLSTSQLNAGGNNDFRNLEQRGISKAASKTNSLRSVVDEIPVEVRFEYHEGSGDHKTALIIIDGRTSCGAPFSLRATLEVEDSPNAVAPLIDAIRCSAAARAQSRYGYLDEASGMLMKSPRQPINEPSAIYAYEQFISELA